MLEPQLYEEEPEGIAVHVRVRPLNSFERSRGDHECVHCDEATQTVRFVTQPATGRGGGGGGVVKALKFDSAVSGSSQVDVFRTVRTQALLQDALQGYAVTVFAYGQTGSGADGPPPPGRARPPTLGLALTLIPDPVSTLTRTHQARPSPSRATTRTSPTPKRRRPLCCGKQGRYGQRGPKRLNGRGWLELGAAPEHGLALTEASGMLAEVLSHLCFPHRHRRGPTLAPLACCHAPSAPSSRPSRSGRTRGASRPARCARRTSSCTTSRSTTCSTPSRPTCSCARTHRRASSSRTCCRQDGRVGCTVCVRVLCGAPCGAPCVAPVGCAMGCTLILTLTPTSTLSLTLTLALALTTLPCNCRRSTASRWPMP